MCLVEIAKMPKLQTACTTFISEGMVVTTESDTVKQARKTMLEFVLQNHPLDCPVCDAGGQCELQDATLSYGPGESRLIDPKNHKDEQQWSPIVYFRSAALHHVLPLRARLWGGNGCLGTRHRQPQLSSADCPQQSDV